MTTFHFVIIVIVVFEIQRGDGLIGMRSRSVTLATEDVVISHAKIVGFEIFSG